MKKTTGIQIIGKGTGQGVTAGAVEIVSSAWRRRYS
jgi:hypothetical protein